MQTKETVIQSMAVLNPPPPLQIQYCGNGWHRCQNWTCISSINCHLSLEV